MDTGMLKCHSWHAHMSILTAVSYEIPDNKGRYCRGMTIPISCFEREKSQNSQTSCELDSFCTISLSSSLRRHFCFCFFGQRSTAFGILVPRPENEPLPPEWKHWVLPRDCQGNPQVIFSKICSTDTTCILNRGNMQSSAMLPDSRGFFLRRTCHPGFQLAEKSFPDL